MIRTAEEMREAAQLLLLLCAVHSSAWQTVSVQVDVSAAISQADPGFKCWNIDGSTDRQWDSRDLSDPLLTSLGQQSLPGYLRFGGSGNNDLRYALDMGDLTSAGNRCVTAATRCLNRSWTDNLANFAAASGAKLVFGLNMGVCEGGSSDECYGKRWDPAEAEVLMRYLSKANHSVFAFELGNEQDAHYTPKQAATNFKLLSELLVEVWPDAATRPKVIGPDVHGFHSNPNTSPSDRSKLEYLAQFVANCSLLGVRLHAATHHEYIEVAESAATPPPASLLQITNQIAQAVNTSLSTVDPTVQIWAGEIGPHNGGKVGHTQAACDSTKRWSNFGDSHWYLDSMGAKSAAGYSVFCRQDFVGIDYGMIDCASYQPLPDYYSGILWSRLMGTEVLAVTSTSSSVRAYAHCTPGHSGAISVLLINLDPDLSQNVTIDGISHLEGVEEWHLSGPNGTSSANMALNGKLLEAKVNGSEYILPSLDGHVIPVTPDFHVVHVYPASIVFIKMQTTISSRVCDKPTYTSSHKT